MDLIDRNLIGDMVDSNGNVHYEDIMNIPSLELPSVQPEPCEDTVSRQRLLSDLKELIVAWEKYPVMAEQIKGVEAAIGYVELIPSAQPERKNDIIQKFHDYQVEWLKSHYDIELEPQLEEMIVRFLHDTANCYMMEVENE